MAVVEVRPSSTSTHWALDALGFKEASANLFVRPDNLSDTISAVSDLARGIGVSSKVLFVEARPVNNTHWSQLWNPAALNDTYIETIKRINKSHARLLALPVSEAQYESFLLGGEAIKLLAKDPLLPEQWVNVEAREKLWQVMLAYDLVGKEVWANTSETHNTMPARQLVRAL